MANAGIGAPARPALAGAAYLVSVSAWALTLTLSDDRVQGVSVPSVRQLIATRFRSEVIETSVVVLAIALVIGLVLGALSGWVVSLRDRLAGRKPGGESWRALLLLVAVHLGVWMRDLAQHPHAYMSSIWARGGLRAWLGGVVVERLGPTVIGVVLVLGVVVWFVWPLGKTWREKLASVLDYQRRNRSPLIAFAVILGATLLCGLAQKPHSPKKQSDRPNVLLIAADSLREDYLTQKYAPHLQKLAERGTRFERAYVTLPRTFPSWVSILTGNDPHRHGIRTMFPGPKERERHVDAIPGRFRDAGYHTAVVSDFAGDIFRRMDLGFERVRTPTFDLRELVRETIVGGQLPVLPFLRGPSARAFLPALGELHDATNPRQVTCDTLAEIDRAGNRPFFVVAFYSSTHFPYAAPHPYFNRFTEKGYSGRFRYGKTPSLRQEQDPTADDVQAIRATYAGAVSSVDDAASQLLRGLEERKLERSTIVVITADHGESLYEPGRGQGHGDHLFGSESTRVPLVFFDPAHAEPRKVSDVVRSVDIAPTLCALAAVECASDVDGRSLRPLLVGEKLAPRPAFAETGIWFTRNIPDVPPSMRMPYADLTELLQVDEGQDGALSLKPELAPLIVTAKHRMILDGRYKLVYVPTRAGVRFLLYDLVADPDETRDVRAQHPEIAARLESQLWAWMLGDLAMERREGFLLPKRGVTP